MWSETHVSIGVSRIKNADAFMVAENDSSICLFLREQLNVVVLGDRMPMGALALLF